MSVPMQSEDGLNVRLLIAGRSDFVCDGRLSAGPALVIVAVLS